MDAQERQKMTERQREVYEFVRLNIAFYGPTVREIAAAMSMKSPNAVMHHLKALERKGYIARDPRKPRGIKVCQ